MRPQAEPENAGPPSTDAKPVRNYMAVQLGLSIFCAYIAAALLVVGPPLLMVEPIPLLGDLSVLDELADLGIVRDVDVGTGFMKASPEDMNISRRDVSATLLLFAFLAIALSYLGRGIRQRLLGSHFGIPSSVPGQIAAFLYGRGLNTVFPFGPGEMSAAKTLVRNGADENTARKTVLCNRAFELVGIAVFLFIAFIISGWANTLLPYFLCAIVAMILIAVSRPRVSHSGARVRGWRSTWQAYRAETLLLILKNLFQKSFGFTVAITLLSALILGLELCGLYVLKQAFSTRDFFLLTDLPVEALIMAIGIANLARVIPVTPGGTGIYELLLVSVLSLYGADNYASITVAILDGVFTNIVMLALFLPALFLIRGSGPSIFESLGAFFRHSIKSNQKIHAQQTDKI